MDFVLKVIEIAKALGEDKKFQSLFYWILFLRTKTGMVQATQMGVSILVLLDFVLKAVLDEQEQVGQGLFQSLFYWILFLRKIAQCRGNWRI